MIWFVILFLSAVIPAVILAFVFTFYLTPRAAKSATLTALIIRFNQIMNRVERLKQ